MNAKQLEALARKNAAKAIKNTTKPRPSFDPTLDATRPKNADDTGEAERMFKEMKKREF
jgi:hypothetical protein